MRQKQIYRAFTLIELLVVISIISVLTAIILPNMMNMRQRARDSQRKSSLNQLKTALRLYYNDSQKYPTDDGNGIMNGCVNGATACSAGGQFANGTTVYMKQLPSTFSYQQTDGGDGFLAWVALENQSDADIAASKTRCNGTLTGVYYVCSD